MPSGFPGNYSICNAQSVGALPASSHGTTITASGSTNTKGTYTSLITATTYDCCFVMIEIVVSTAALMLVDIAIGTSGNQIVVVPNIWCGASANVTTATRCSLAVAFPLNIPAGTNIWARCQSATASATCLVTMQLFDGSFTMPPGVAGYDDLGTSLAASTGTSVTPSATANTLGTWTSIVTSTARAYMGIWGTIGLGTTLQSMQTNIGIGGSGTQQIIIPTFAQFNANAVGVNSAGTLPFLPIQIPAGTQIWAQNQTSVSSSVAQNILLYGAYQ